MNRALRRHLTSVKCKQRQKTWHISSQHVFGFFFFAKRRPLGCECSKKKHGRPKVAMGLCNIGERKRILLHRRLSREFCNHAQKNIFHYDPMLDSCWKLRE